MEYNFRRISVKSRFFLFITGMVLFWLLSGFLVYSLVDNIARLNKTYASIQSLPVKILELENSVNNFYISDIRSEAFQESGRSEELSHFDEAYIEAFDQLRDLRSIPLITNDPVVYQKLDQLQESLSNTDAILHDITGKTRQRGWSEFGICGTLNQMLDDMETTGSGATEPELMQSLELELRSYLLNPQSSRIPRIEDLVNALTGTGNNSGSLPQFLSTARTLLMLDRELGISRYEGLQGKLFRSISVLHEESNAINELFALEKDKKRRQFNLEIALIIIVSCLLFSIVIFFIGKSVLKPLYVLQKYVHELARGKLPSSIHSRKGDEFDQISGMLNAFIDSLRQKARFATDLAEGKNSEEPVALGEEDLLANALIKMGRQIRSAKIEDQKHQKSNEERRWANEGIAKFGDILRMHSNEISALAENVIQELVGYLNASAGGFFLVSDDPENPNLELIASFAFDRKKYLKKQFAPGEGLVGTCAIEKEKIVLTDIPDDYINISSGLGESKPRSLILIPLKLEEQILGVMEIASISNFQEFEIRFVEDLAESIAIAVSTVRMNMRTSRLLEQSREQAHEMAKQEELLRQQMEELQTTQEESARRESEISGILNAIHNSSLVAEYNMEEELVNINERFLSLLESQKTQMIGKKHHEITGVSRYTDIHKQFWENMREGNTITKVEKIVVQSGRNIWLRQTFTPILDNEGKPFKVLNIASDITETVEQQESLEKQAAEITRTNIEMKTFGNAVDAALIKCVYSPAGQILEVNENYETATGYTRKEMVGKNIRTFLQRIEKEQFDKIWEDIQKDKPYRGVIRRTKPTGEEIWIMSTFTPVKDEKGNIFKVIYLGQDITEKKLKYQLLEEANREIERLRKQLDERGKTTEI